MSEKDFDLNVKRKILRAAVKLFLSVGYEKTTIIKIAEEAKVNRGSVIYAFKDKESIVSELVSLVLEGQFKCMREFLAGKTQDKLLFYACETTLQLYLAESSEHMREMYSVSYSMPKSSSVIFNTITAKLKEVFQESLPDWETKDFFEREISSAGIMRNHMAIPCDMYFTMERKIHSFLESTFLLYRVSDERIKEAIDFVMQFNWKEIAQNAIDGMYDYLISQI